MSLQILTEPHLFMGGLTATGNIFGAFTPNLLTSFYSWTSTSSTAASSFPIPVQAGVIYEGPNNSGNFIVSVGGVVQSPTLYTIDSVYRYVNFNTPVSAGIEVSVTQLGTAFLSAQSFNDLQSDFAAFAYTSGIDAFHYNLTAENILSNNLTVISAAIFSTEYISTTSLLVEGVSEETILKIVQGGTGKAVSVTGTSVLSGNNQLPILRITQTGSGNVLEVEDSTHPDSTLFRITSSGRVIVGTSSSGQTASESGALSIIDTPEVGGRHINLFQTGNDLVGSNVWFFKTRGTTVDSQVALGSADNIMVLASNASDGEAYRRVGDIILRTDGPVTLSSVPTRLTFSTTSTGSVTANNRMVITNSGDVGINTSTPNERLTVMGNISASEAVFASGGNSNFWNLAYTLVQNNSASWEESASIVPTTTNYLSTNLVTVSSLNVTQTLLSANTNLFNLFLTPNNTLTTSICAMSGDGVTPFVMQFTNGLLTSITV